MEGNRGEKRKLDLSTTGTHSGNSSITVEVKYGEESISVTVPPGTTVLELKAVLNFVFNVFPAYQKLICRGELLEDKMRVQNNTRIRLFPMTPNLSEEAERKAYYQRLIDLLENHDIELSIAKNWSDRWMRTGIIALSDLHFKVIPVEVWNCGPSATLLDISNNIIQKIPAQISRLSSLQTLLLHENLLSSETISWGELMTLRSLTFLNLSGNQLKVLPPELGALTSLEKLYVSRNLLTSIPNEIGRLSHLGVLKVDNNRLSTIPASIGDCINLVQVDLSTNAIVELPETICRLKNLKDLLLNNNNVKSLPSTIFKACSQLKTLEIDNTGITTDTLPALEGWEDFDRKCRP